jgi:CheY-like chemotaxis protein
MQQIGVIIKYLDNTYHIDKFLKDLLHVDTLEDFRIGIDLNNLKDFDNLINVERDSDHNSINVNINTKFTFKNVLISKFIPNKNTDNIDFILHIYIINDDKKISFLPNTLHEIINLLNSIVGILSILQDTDLDTEQYGYLEMIKESSYNLLSIVKTNQCKKNNIILSNTVSKKTINILIAEDNCINQKIIVKYLNKLGYDNLKIVDNGNKCLQELELKEYDILFTDIKMPSKSGDEVIMIIQDYFAGTNKNGNDTYKFQNKTKPYLIAVTAYSEKQNFYLDKGFDKIMTKPIQLIELNTLLELLFKKV